MRKAAGSNTDETGVVYGGQVDLNQEFPYRSFSQPPGSVIDGSCARVFPRRWYLETRMQFIVGFN